MTDHLDTKWIYYDKVLNALPSAGKPQFLGKVTRVLGLIIEAFLPNMPVGGMCTIRVDDDTYVDAEVVGLKGEHVMMMPIGDITGIKHGCSVEPKDSQASVIVSDKLLGRVLNAHGNPIDGGPDISSLESYSLYASPVDPIKRKRIESILPLGVRVIDGLLTCGIGQRMAIMAGSGVGKSVLLGMIAKYTQADINVIALVGERGREVREFIERDLGEEGLKRSVIVVATSDEPPLVRTRAAFMATAIAEYFRDKGKQVLLLMDSLTRFSMAMREVGLAIGEPPTSKGYTPTVFSVLPKLLERVGTTNDSGSITGLYTVLTEGDDIQDPIADSVRSIVDGHIVLSRKLAGQNHYPAVDIMNSLSRLHRDLVEKDHLKSADQFRTLWANYMDMEDFINMGIYAKGKNKTVDEAIGRIDSMRNFLQQGYDQGDSFDRTQTNLRQVVGY